MSTDRVTITNVTVQLPVLRIVRVPLPQNEEECNLIVRIRAQNRAGTSSPTEMPVGMLISYRISSIWYCYILLSY